MTEADGKIYDGDYVYTPIGTHRGVTTYSKDRWRVRPYPDDELFQEALAGVAPVLSRMDLKP